MPRTPLFPLRQLFYSPAGGNNLVKLPFGTSLYDLKQPGMPPAADLTVKGGLQLFSPSAALVKVPDAFFLRNPIETQIAADKSRRRIGVVRLLLDGGHSKKAGQIASAFRRIGWLAIAQEIVKTMKRAGYDVRETDPFSHGQKLARFRSAAAPIVSRLQGMWKSMRDSVIEVFPKAPGLPKNKVSYLRFVDEIYRHDAYHSLSIEGYVVSPALIERVRQENGLRSTARRIERTSTH